MSKEQEQAITRLLLQFEDETVLSAFIEWANERSMPSLSEFITTYRDCTT